MPPPSTVRRPLGTISLALSPSQSKPLSRLKKGPRREEPEGKGNDAFKLMMNARRSEHKDTKPLEKSIFFEAEAVESDEEDSFGFGAKQKGDEEEEDENEDPDAILPDLVDDTKMDADTLAEEKVLEKVR